MMAQRAVRALLLMSGGLDSRLAAALLMRQGIQVAACTFESVFFDAEQARKASLSMGIPCRAVNFTHEILRAIAAPRHGFGAGINPCIDCHAAMIRKAGEIMRAEGFDFVATGEVLNERPMSQTRRALETVARDSGLEGLVLRPLSAKLLDITEPEKKGLVDREKLGAINGRSRREQLAMAHELGITGFPQPAGGCLLTDRGYARKLRDLKEHEGLNNLDLIRLLRVGRHFRINARKLVVGRNREENAVLENSSGTFAIILKTVGTPGPSAVLSAGASGDDIRLAASVCARYADRIGDNPVTFEISGPDGKQRIVVMPSDLDAVANMRV